MTRLRQNACSPVISTIALGEQHDLELAAKDRSLESYICDTMHLPSSENSRLPRSISTRSRLLLMLGRMMLHGQHSAVFPSIDHEVPSLHVVHITSIVLVTSPHLTLFLYHSMSLW